MIDGDRNGAVTNDITNTTGYKYENLWYMSHFPPPTTTINEHYMSVRTFVNKYKEVKKTYFDPEKFLLEP